MKTALKILSTLLVAMFFASCSQQAVYYDGGGAGATVAEATVIESSSAKGEYVSPVFVKQAAPKYSESKHCSRCLSSYCPKPGCCGTVSNAVLSRATMQGGSGEPHIGLIPTMKTLAPAN